MKARQHFAGVLLIKGVIGEVDGAKIVKSPVVPSSGGCAFFILCHPLAATAPKQREEKVQDPRQPSRNLPAGLCEEAVSSMTASFSTRKVGGILSIRAAASWKKLTVQSVAHGDWQEHHFPHPVPA
ncbi:MAG: hypothetical protein ACLR8L_00090 [Oscillospiraceae bacterium]